MAEPVIPGPLGNYCAYPISPCAFCRLFAWWIGPINMSMLEDQRINAPPASVAAKRTNAVPRERASASTVIKYSEHEGRAVSATVADGRWMTALLPIMGVVSVAFLVIGLALPVLPLHVHQGLGLSTFVVGLVTGSQFAASLVSRVWSGHYADSKGPKRAVVVGLLTAVAGGLLYLLSLGFVGTPWLSAAILLCGRALLGGAESLVITGAVSWGLALPDPQTPGRSSHGLEWRCLPRLRSARRSVPRFTPMAGSLPSPWQRS